MLSDAGVASCGHWSLLQGEAYSFSGPVAVMGAQGSSFFLSKGVEALIFFGGVTHSGALPKVLWQFVPSENKWSIIPSNNGPEGRIHHALLRLKSPNGDARIVLLGGSNVEGSALGDMWTVHPEPDHPKSQRWQYVDYPGPHPCPRYGHTMIGTSRGTLMVFGGYDNAAIRLDDLWEFSPTWFDADSRSGHPGNWTQRMPINQGPSARAFHSMACLRGADIIVFGGQGREGQSSNDLWHFSDAQSSWTKLSDSGPASDERPAPRHQQAMTQVGDTALMFGGKQQMTDIKYDDFWELITVGYETNLQAKWRRTDRLGPSFRHASALVPAQGSAFLFGGFGGSAQNSNSFLSDLWHFSACVCKEGHQRVAFELAYGCDACPLNTFKDATGLMPCSSCPRNSFSDAMTSSILNCTCNGGYTRTSIANCSACAPGKYKTVGDGPCNACGSGSFAASSAATACSICQNNSVSEAGDARCSCVRGYTRGTLARRCIPCQANTYKDGVSNGACTTCPPNTVSLPGSIALENCTCPIGFGVKGDPWRSLHNDSLSYTLEVCQAITTNSSSPTTPAPTTPSSTPSPTAASSTTSTPMPTSSSTMSSTSTPTNVLTSNDTTSSWTNTWLTNATSNQTTPQVSYYETSAVWPSTTASSSTTTPIPTTTSSTTSSPLAPIPSSSSTTTPRPTTTSSSSPRCAVGEELLNMTMRCSASKCTCGADGLPITLIPNRACGCKCVEAEVSPHDGCKPCAAGYAKSVLGKSFSLFMYLLVVLVYVSLSCSAF